MSIIIFQIKVWAPTFPFAAATNFPFGAAQTEEPLPTTQLDGTVSRYCDSSDDLRYSLPHDQIKAAVETTCGCRQRVSLPTLLHCVRIVFLILPNYCWLNAISVSRYNDFYFYSVALVSSYLGHYNVFNLNLKPELWLKFKIY